MYLALSVLTVQLADGSARTFPVGKAANFVRGRLGLRMAPKFFSPSSFVLRVPPGPLTGFRMHVFGGAAEACRQAALEAFPGCRVKGEERNIPLIPESCDRMTVEFITPTELKHQNSPFAEPAFPILFSRAAERVCSLLPEPRPSLPDPWTAGVVLSHLEVTWEKLERRSFRTGQTHPLGGFTGRASYRGTMDLFLPWLKAAQWTGVGRQTMWGKGEIRVTPGTPGE